jgi:hypothetical protein
MTIRLACALGAVLCALAVLFVDLKANDLKVLAVGVILAAFAAVLDR